MSHEPPRGSHHISLRLMGVCYGNQFLSYVCQLVCGDPAALYYFALLLHDTITEPRHLTLSRMSENGNDCEMTGNVLRVL